MDYQNPILTGFYPDPSICKVKGGFYLVCSSFEFMPSIPIFYSENLVQWEQIGNCLDREGMVNMADTHDSGGIFAPTIRYHQGLFYIITTNITQGNFIITAKDPAGDWSEPLWLPELDGIDPSLFFEDEKVYVQYSGQNEHDISAIRQCQIDLKTGKRVGEDQIISMGTGGRDVEGPHLYRKDDYYYLMLAEGGTREGHYVTMFRSTHIWGPFEAMPTNPLVTNRDRPDLAIQSTGHADLVADDNGHYWLVLLGTRPNNLRHLLGRETSLVPLEWSKGTWPECVGGVVNEKIETVNLPKPLIAPYPTPVRVKQLPLDFSWNFIRGINAQYVELHEDFLKITASEASLNDKTPNAFIGRRQTAFDFNFSGIFNPALMKDKQEVGIAIYKDTHHHFDLLLTMRAQQPTVILRKNVADLIVEESRAVPSFKDVKLMISGDRDQYHFAYACADADAISIGQTETSHLTSEVADAPFTGLYMGVYATSNAQKETFETCVSELNYQTFL